MTAYTIQIEARSQAIVAPYKIKKKGYLLKSCDPWLI